jgi:monoamine oxidase
MVPVNNDAGEEFAALSQLGHCPPGPTPNHHPAAMTRLNRRTFLAGSAAMSASMTAPPALGQGKQKGPQQPTGGFDAIIVGAGAAGIAAARRLVAAGRRVAIVEAAAEVGGRCITDTKIFGVPYDRGAHWIHTPDINPVAKLAPQTGLDIYPAPPGQRIRIGRRFAREGEMEDYLSTLVRAGGAISDAARKGDVPCAQALPKDLGEWRSTVEFFLGPFGCGKDLGEISALDFARSSERDIDTFCRQGFGSLLAKLATGLPVQLSNPATEIGWGGRGVEVMTARGRFTGTTAIVTVSTNVLSARKIKFNPELPRRHLDAAGKLKLGSYDHIALELPDNPLGLRNDELVFEKSKDNKTAAIFANASGSTLCLVDVAGSFGRDLSAKGEKEMVAFALGWLSDLFGSDIKSMVRRTHATRWNDDPNVLGAFSSASPGGQPSRKILMEPLNNRIFLAGEAAHETLWGTVGGAWESGERAADAVIRLITGRR